MTTATPTQTIQEILKQEAERSRAISEQDWPALDRILAGDYSHVHMPGRMEDKPAYVAGLKGRPRKTERHDLKVRLYGDTAVMTGRMINRRDNGDNTEAMVTQTWIKRSGAWQCVAFQASKIGDA